MLDEKGGDDSLLSRLSHTRSSVHEDELCAEQGRLLLVSLLENFCALYDRDPRKNKKLFLSLCRKLHLMGILKSADFLDKHADLRCSYRSAFKQLVLRAIGSSETPAELDACNLERHSANLLIEEEVSDEFTLSGSISDSISSQNVLFDALINSPGRESAAISISDELDRISRPSRFENDFIELELIGRGGFGVVVKARNVLDQRCYAVKRIPFSNDSSSKLTSILREVKSLARLDHPNIVRYYSAWIEDCCEPLSLSGGNKDSAFSNPLASSSVDPTLSRSASTAPTKSDSLMVYLQMELCDFTLEDYISQRNALIFGEKEAQKKAIRLDRLVSVDLQSGKYTINAYESRRIFKAIVKGLHYIHGQGLMHRDLKPHNILFAGDDYSPKISDFGLASDVSMMTTCSATCGICSFVECNDPHAAPSHAEPPEADVPHQAITTAPLECLLTKGIGTSTYASPEQLNSATYNEKADIYSLGIIFFELFCPFRTQMERARILASLKEHKLFPPNFVRSWPKEVAPSLMHASRLHSCGAASPRTKKCAPQPPKYSRANSSNWTPTMYVLGVMFVGCRHASRGKRKSPSTARHEGPRG